MFSSEFMSLVNRLPENYKSCLLGYIKEMINNNDPNINSIILFGGLVREKKVIENWSDIDLLIIYNDIDCRDFRYNSRIKKRYESEYSIRIDLNEIDIEEISSDNFISIKYNSEFTNVLAFRKDVSMVVFGEFKPLLISKEYEKTTAVYYINNTVNQYRKFLVDNFMEDNIAISTHIIPRITRWVFSIIRASLRLFDIYSHPYNESLTHLKTIFPDMNIDILEKLLNIREGKLVYDNQRIIDEIDMFLSTYINAIRGKRDENECRK